ncbi:carbohydrate ABC transporter membrane protein 1, CUT1 family [Microlunatus soli]|uniref:Carbohydrate ABC transporter membrane protein 1, CUT1 family n=2 Tax=Microlunatus soli TaxID=630515 RepID=A0A1H1YKS7_9ACTN|nr:carbohydrate ABC transporter membrane protein 1, CUT1 family [Microlunatus soli]
MTSARGRRSLLRRIAYYRWSYLFVLPGAAFFVVFAYIPLAGNVVAFQDYSPFRGVESSPFVGWSNFAAMFTDPEVITALTNTIIISALQILFAFPAPVALALLLNSLLSVRVQRVVQAIVYLPHFISWVVVIAIWQQVLGGAGIINDVLALIGLGPQNVMADPDAFKPLVTAQVIWKEIGWGTIIFFAAISTIPHDRYESAAIDGAGAWRRIWHVTLPGIMPVIVLLLILRLGAVLTVGFEQILLQQDSVGKGAAQVLDTFVYFRGVIGGDWGLAAAAGLFKGAVGTVMVIGANWLSKRLGSEGLF